MSVTGFGRGERVRLIHDPSRAGEITGATREVAGKLYFGVRLGDGSGVQMLPAGQLEILRDEADAIQDLRRARHSPPETLRRLLTHIRLTGNLADMIYSMEATNTEFHAYQFKPVVKLLNAPTRGLLIADEVGLGKTIEAGLIWTELVARSPDISRLLVICPKSLTEKWRLELQEKFGVYARIVRAGELLSALEGDASSGDGFALIASLSSVRPPRDWEEPDRDGDRARLARHLRDLAGDRALFDLVIFDEAHHLRNAETLGHDFAALAVAAADYKRLVYAETVTRKDRTGFAQGERGYDYPVVKVGGGFASEVHRSFADNLGGALCRPFVAPAVDGRLIRDAGSDAGRLLLADGLARDPIEISGWLLPDDRDHLAGGRWDYDGRFTSKDQT